MKKLHPRCQGDASIDNIDLDVVDKRDECVVGIVNVTVCGLVEQ